MVRLENSWQNYCAQDPNIAESNAFLEDFRACFEVGQDPNAFHGLIINTLREETDTIIMAKSPPDRKIIGMEGFGPSTGGLEIVIIVFFIIIIILGLEIKMLKAELAKKKNLSTVEGDPPTPTSVNTNNSIVGGVEEIFKNYGKFTIVNGTPYFTANKSTNGVFLKRKIDADEPLELLQGMVLSLGKSDIEIVELLDQDPPIEDELPESVSPLSAGQEEC